MSSATAETLEFKAELKQLLHLITHSLYSDRNIFLRELISNASDAINKVKFDSLDNDEQLEGNKEWQIVITPNAEAKTLTISDNGIGMSRDDVIENLGTVAKSGTKAFLEAIKSQNKPDAAGLIGQFGVGFYSAFMVADKVEVHTRPAGGAELGSRWESDGQGEFQVEPLPKADRGTDVILHLKEDALNYLNSWEIKNLVRKFSDFIEHPVVLVTTKPVEEKPDEEKSEEEKSEEEKADQEPKFETVRETINSRKAIWLRSPREVTQDEYNEFYKQVSRDFEPPGKILHFSIEGSTEFKALLFIPAKKPYGYEFQQTKSNLRLYAQRVMIMENCEDILPQYMRFVSGVVDCADLPLNVSRELLQGNPHLETIKKNVVRNVFSGLEGMKNTELDKYKTFYKGLGQSLKEGLLGDFQNQQKIVDLLLFESAKSEPGQLITVAEYVQAMPEGQSEIYYLIGDDGPSLRNSPHLEGLKAKGYDVLLFTDPIDSYITPGLPEYQGKKFVSADATDAPSPADELPEEVRNEFSNLLAAFKAKLPETSEVRLSRRLTDSAACLVEAVDSRMRDFSRLYGIGDDANSSPKWILELNPNHPVVQATKTLHAADPASPKLDDYARLLFDQAAIAQGVRVTDPVRFTKLINEMLLNTTDKPAG